MRNVIIGLAVAATIAALLWLVRLLAHRRDTEKARKLQERAESGDDLARARLAVDEGRWESAAKAFLAAERNADAARAFEKAGLWGRAGAVWEAEEDPRRAARAYEQAEDTEAVLRVLRGAEMWADAARVALRDGEKGKAAALLLRGGLKLDAARLYREVGESELAYRLAAEDHEENERWELAAQAWWRAERWADASRCLMQAEQWDMAARALIRQGRHTDAAELLERNGEPAAAARAWEASRRFADAARCFETVGDLEGEARCRELAGDRLGVVQLWIARGDHDRAIALVDATPAHDPHFVEATQIAVGLREASGDTEGALESLQRLLQVELPPKQRLRVLRHAVELAIGLERRGVGQPLFEELAVLAKEHDEEARWLHRMADSLAELPVDEHTPTVATPPPQPPVTGPEALADTLPDNDDMIAAVDRALLASTRERRRFKLTGGARLPRAPEGWPSGVPTVLAARYADVERVGRGGHGVVYKARDILTERVVALKFMSDSDLPDDLARRYFVREMSVATSLTHPNIVRIHDMGIADERLYYSMEYLDGQPLKALMKPEPESDTQLLVSIVSQLLEALAYAHGRGLIHRDVKPENMVVLADGTLKLLDFGLAKVLDEGFGEMSVVAGTPTYMAPELLAGQQVDGRADLYAVGVLLYRLVTGRPPFVGGNLFLAHALEPPPEPRTFNPELSDALRVVILKSLEKDPADRYASAEALAEAFLAAVQAPPTAAQSSPGA